MNNKYLVTVFVLPSLHNYYLRKWKIDVFTSSSKVLIRSFITFIPNELTGGLLSVTVVKPVSAFFFKMTSFDASEEVNRKVWRKSLDVSLTNNAVNGNLFLFWFQTHRDAPIKHNSSISIMSQLMHLTNGESRSRGSGCVFSDLA